MNKSQKILLSIHATYGLATTMSGLFLNLYLWKLSNDLSTNATFMLFTFLFGVCSFWVGGVISKLRDRLVSYRIGIGLTAFFYLIIIVLQEKITDISIVIGMVNGTASGFYWLGFLVLFYDLVDSKSQSAFLGKQNAIFGLANICGPALAGFIISLFSLFGYRIVFCISFFLFFAGVLLSLKLPLDVQKKQRLNIPLLLRFNRRSSDLKLMWLGWTIWGTCEGLLGFYPSLLLFMAVKNELMIGFFSILLGIISVLSSLWHSKYNHKNRGPYTILFMWIIYFSSSIPIITIKNVWCILLFLIVNEVSKNLIGISYFSHMLRMMGTLLPRRASLRTESMILREVMLNIGRLFSILTFLVLNHFSTNLTVYVMIFAISLQGFLYKIISKKNEPLVICNKQGVKSFKG